LNWKKQVPTPIRKIVEGKMKGLTVENKETGLKLVDQFLSKLNQNIQGQNTNANIVLDKRVEGAINMIEKIETSEGKLDIFSALSNPASSWGIKKELYQTQIEPLLEWLASESLRDQEKKISENNKSEESSSSDNPEMESGSDGESKSDSDVPPSSEDAISSMEHGVEKNEGESGKPYFSINPFFGGYYKQHIYDKFDSGSGRWKKRSKYFY